MLTLHVADALSVARTFGANTFDAIITDPPYSTGANLNAKAISTAFKYTTTEQNCPHPDFECDSLDQRSWTNFMSELLLVTRHASRTGAICAVFSDWRQLPSLTDAIQRAGWVWRGVAVWHKPGAQPQKGRFRQETEFIVWGSNGALPFERGIPPLPGLFSYANVPANERVHQVQKPLQLMRDLLQICTTGGTVFDPFCGSGTTLAAARDLGLNAIGAELSPTIAQTAIDRLHLTQVEKGVFSDEH